MTRIAVAAIGCSFLKLDGYPTAEQQQALVRGMREEYLLSNSDAEEMVILGRWNMAQCNGSEQAVPRLTRRLFKLEKQTHFEPLMKIIKSVAASSGGDISNRQKTAIEDIRQGMRISRQTPKKKGGHLAPLTTV